MWFQICTRYNDKIGLIKHICYLNIFNFNSIFSIFTKKMIFLVFPLINVSVCSINIMLPCRTCTRIGSWAWRPWPRRPAAARRASAVRTRPVTATARSRTLSTAWTRRPSCWGCRAPPATPIWSPPTPAPPSPSAPPTTPSASPTTWWSRGTSRRRWMLATGSECTLLVRTQQNDSR